MAQTTAWIFVSHASDDLYHVRKVRNYMEDQGAAPLLFHLMALTEPKEFWPIIEREIQARSFFLYCESNAAEASSWVQQERDAVERARVTAPKRIARIRVDGDGFDKQAIDDFLSKTRVFPSYARADRLAVLPFLTALESVGFQVFRDEKDISLGADFKTKIDEAIDDVAVAGWMIYFLSASSIKSQWVRFELETAVKREGKLIIVALEKPETYEALPGIQVFDAFSHPDAAPIELANLLLSR